MPTEPARTLVSPAAPSRLDEAGLLRAVEVLTAIDPDLAGIAERHGPPPLWAREPGFGTLVRIILEQHVSLASAEAALRRVVVAAGAIEPGAIVIAGEDGLRSAGLTRQKSRYLVGLAGDVLDGRLDLEAVAVTDDDEARARLTGVVGIGRWTADIYLLMALGRPDIWPVGDLALAGAMRRAKALPALPRAAEQVAIAETWRPWRAVAARLLWHAYLAGERWKGGAGGSAPVMARTRIS
jgi:DNA-3-methyladenine glycosylase II